MRSLIAPQTSSIPTSCTNVVIGAEAVAAGPTYWGSAFVKQSTRQLLVVFTQYPIPPEPAECPLHHPAARQHRECFLPRRSLDNRHRPAPTLLHPADQLPRVPAIRPDQSQPGKPPRQLRQHQFRPVPILHARRMHHHRKHQSDRVYGEMAFPSLDLLPRVVAPHPPCIFSMWHTATRWRGRPQPPWSLEAVKKRRSPRPYPIEPGQLLGPFEPVFRKVRREEGECDDRWIGVYRH